jgi:hypothetical protein
VGKLFGDYVAQEAPPDARVESTLRVIVGKTFHGDLAPAATDSTPEHAPPTTVRELDDVSAALQRLRGQTDFPLLVPSLTDRSSTLDSEVPVRRYRLEGHDALKIVYHYGDEAGAYWGVMETSWTEAPIFDEPSQRKRAGGRDLRLYYNGSRLHMVAFAENGALYWVTNTLLDDLSNETMLSIARGLKPMGPSTA